MSQNSKLSEALAATLLRFKEIDRDTIEALCKRAASLEHQVTQNTADINRETTLRSMLQDTKDQLADWQKAEQAISSSYLKIRGILGANSSAWMEPNPAEPQIQRLYEYTENVAEQLVKSHNQLQWALRELLAQTRDLHDAGPEGESYQSDTLENAIAVADALVGESATEQYPIADEPLNRRIQELELKLAEAKKPKGSIHIARDSIETKEGTGNCRVRVGYIDAPEAAKIGVGAFAEIDPEGLVAKMDQPVKWSENALRKLMKDVLADREAEQATSFNEMRESMDGLMATTFKQAQENLAKLPRDMDLKSVITVTGDEAIGALVKEIINTEMRPGGRIHKALIGH